MAKLNCIVVTPEATVVEQPADFAALPLYDGEIGIAPGHSPLIGRLGYGELRIRSGDSVARYFIDGGFVQVADNDVSVLTNRAVPAAELDAAAALRQLEEVRQRPTNSPEQFAARERSEARARGQLRVAQRSAK